MGGEPRRDGRCASRRAALIPAIGSGVTALLLPETPRCDTMTLSGNYWASVLSWSCPPVTRSGHAGLSVATMALFGKNSSLVRQQLGILIRRRRSLAIRVPSSPQRPRLPTTAALSGAVMRGGRAATNSSKAVSLVLWQQRCWPAAMHAASSCDDWVSAA